MDEHKIALVKYRFDKAQEEYKISKNLFESGFYRVSLGNSYYSIFHSVRTLLALEEVDSKKHTGLIHLFSKLFVETGLLKENLRKILNHSFEHRLDSDYEDFYVAEKSVAEEQPNNAGLFLNEIKYFVKKHYQIDLQNLK